MHLRTIVVIAVLSLVWLGFRRAEDSVTTSRSSSVDSRLAHLTPIEDGVVDLVLEARDTEGQPVVALDLILERAGGSEKDARTIVRSLTAASGRYELDGLLPGSWRITLTGRHGRVLTPKAGTWVTLPQAAPLPVLAESPATLEVEITDFQGRSLPGVEVVLRPEAGAQRVSVTDLLGRVRSGPLPGGVVAIDARRAGAEVRHREALAAEAHLVMSLRLPGGALAGRALDAQQTPLGQRRIEVLTRPVAGGPEPQVLAILTTDGRGQFDVPWLPPGPVLVGLVGDAGTGAGDGPGPDWAASVALVIADGARVEATLSLAPTATVCTVRGRFLLERSPIAEAELTWVAGLSGGAGHNGTEAPATHVVRTDRDGRFGVELEHTGPWAVLAALPGRPILELGNFVCDAPGATQRDLFAPVGVVQGRVVDLQGRGVGGARIDCVPATPWVHGALHASPVTAQTVADGSFEVGGLLVGPWRVHAWPSDPALARVQTQAFEVRAHGAAPTLNLVVPPAGGLRVRFAGTALDTGDAVQIEVRDAAGRYVFPEAFAVRGPLGEGVPVPGLAAGTYRCAVRSSLRVTEWTEAIIVRAGEEAEVTVALSAGGELDLTLLDAAGAPVAAALEVLDAGGNDVTRLAEPASEAKGRYRLGPLPAARYTLVARAADGSAARRAFELVAGVTLALELRTGG